MPGISEDQFTEVCQRSIKLRNVLREFEGLVYEYDEYLRAEDEESSSQLVEIINDLSSDLIEDTKTFVSQLKTFMKIAKTAHDPTPCECRWADVKALFENTNEVVEKPVLGSPVRPAPSSPRRLGGPLSPKRNLPNSPIGKPVRKAF